MPWIISPTPPALSCAHRSQDITTFVGTTYILGFFATSDNQNPNGITLSATGLTGLTINNFATSQLGLYVECAATFTATSNTTTITIIGGDVPGYLYADDIYVYACA